MLKKIFIGIGIVLLAIVGFFVYALLFPASPKATATFVDPALEIKVAYSRPYKKGRLIFGDASDKALQPYGKYWRLGANSATEITFSKDVTFGGKPVKAGSYRMYAVPGATSFQISLNSELGVFLAVNEPNYALDVVKVDVPVTPAPAETEQFTITFSGTAAQVDMHLTWDKTQVSVPITTP